MAAGDKTKEITEKVKQIISEQLGVEEAEVTPSASFIDDLGADSLDTVELVMALEENFDIAIIGAGIVGLAVGNELLRRYPDCRLLVLEKESGVARHQTGHNSGVIHSGIYYKPGSLKARMCVEGARAMLDFVQAHGLPHQKCGKVIIATGEDETQRLEELYRRGISNGLANLRWLSNEAEIREVEPYASGVCGIHVPSAAITDFKMVAEKFLTLIIAAGSTVRFNAGVNKLSRVREQIRLSTDAGNFNASYLINCAGLQSDHIARLAGEILDTAILPFRGEYYEVLPAKQHLVRGLLYPVPDPRFPFLGVHFTRRVHGGVEAGPNAVLALRREGYKKTSLSLKDTRGILSYPGFWRMATKFWATGLSEMYRSWSKNAFLHALQKLLPDLDKNDIRYGGAGVRAQAVQRDGKLVDDFLFVHGERATHVLNVPSPAATASLKIAEAVVEMISERLPLTGRMTYPNLGNPVSKCPA